MVLAVKELTVSYGPIRALTEVSLDVRRAAVTAIIGANGAGKSSLLNCISGAVRPAGGAILFGGSDIADLRGHQVVRKGVCLIAQGGRVFPGMTVGQNLVLAARASGRGDDASIEQAMTIFPLLKERYSQRAGTMSGGEQQMLAVARGLSMRPELLLLDEPSLGLAPTVADMMFEKLREIAQLGTTLAIVEQNVRAALGIADHVYVLRNGRLVAEGPPSTISERDYLIGLFTSKDAEGEAPNGAQHSDEPPNDA